MLAGVAVRHLSLQSCIIAFSLLFRKRGLGVASFPETPHHMFHRPLAPICQMFDNPTQTESSACTISFSLPVSLSARKGNQGAQPEPLQAFRMDGLGFDRQHGFRVSLVCVCLVVSGTAGATTRVSLTAVLGILFGVERCLATVTTDTHCRFFVRVVLCTLRLRMRGP